MDYNLKRVAQTDLVQIQGRRYKVEIWNHPDRTKTYDFIDISENADKHFIGVTAERLDNGIRNKKIVIL